MEENLQLKDILVTLRRWRRLIVGVFAAGLLAAVLFIMLVTPRFTAEATLKYNPNRFEINEQKLSVGADLLDRLISGELAAIESPAVLLEVIEREKLSDDPELNRTDLLGALTGVFAGGAAADRSAADRQRMLLLERFKRKVTVAHPDRTNLITVSYQSEDAVKSARITNAIVNIFLARHLESRASETPLATQWLDERTESLRKRWRDSEDQVEQFTSEHKLSYVSGEKLREQHVDRLNEQLVLAGTKTEEARARVDQVRELLKSRDYGQLANVARSETMTRLRDRLAAASQREASLNSTLLPNHPQLKQVRAEVASLRRHIDGEGRRVLDNLEVEFRAARDREALIRGNFDKTIGGIQDKSSALVKLRDLQRKAASDRAIYEAFLNRSNETLEQSAGDFANFHLIQSAQVPVKPSFPSKRRVLLLAAVGSLALGIGLAFVLEMNRGTFRSGRDVSDALKLPTVAALPRISAGDAEYAQTRRNIERAVIDAPNSAFAQSITSLELGLGLADDYNPIQVLAVASAVEFEGKTLVAASLAQAASADGLEVLLIDGDWRKPALRRVFGASAFSHNGTREDESSPVYQDAVTGLDLLPPLVGAQGGGGFAGSREFTDLLASAREHYDLIIIDTGAVTANPDACVLAGQADATLLVVRWDKTRQHVVSQALSALNNWGARVVGVALNGVDFEELAIAGEDVSAGVVQKRLDPVDDEERARKQAGRRNDAGATTAGIAGGRGTGRLGAGA